MTTLTFLFPQRTDLGHKGDVPLPGPRFDQDAVSLPYDVTVHLVTDGLEAPVALAG